MVGNPYLEIVSGLPVIQELSGNFASGIVNRLPDKSTLFTLSTAKAKAGSLEELGGIPVENSGCVAIAIATSHKDSAVGQQQHRVVLARIVQAPGSAERSRRRVVQFRTGSGDLQPAREHPKLPLIKALARAHGWYEKVVQGKAFDMRSLARDAGLTERYVGKVFRCAFLAPDIVEAILAARQPQDLNFDKLCQNVPLSWVEQREQLGFSPANTPRPRLSLVQ